MWRKVEKKSRRSDSPQVTVRSDGLALNKAAGNLIGFNAISYADIFISEDGRKVGISIGDVCTEDSYKVKGDGGSSLGGSAHISCGRALFGEIPQLERGDKLDLYKDDESGLFCFDIGFKFSEKLSSRKPSSKEIGVYRYLLDGEVVYIGQGLIAARISDATRADWEYDDIEYGVLTTKEECEREEASCLRSFKLMNGRLPIYNRIMGRRNKDG